ncbi:MAG: AcvB/VirJ family lysyl-phosphatidylglycerol hydrolase [Alphaproteobacteria bacterium]
MRNRSNKTRKHRAGLIGTLVALTLLGSAQAEEFPHPDSQGTALVSVTKPSHTLILFLSGDGGWWGDIDAQLANRFAGEGYAVVGIDTQIWFGPERTVPEIAGHLAELANKYGRATHADKLVLIGYSYGANVIPLALQKTPRDFNAKLAAIVLIAPERKTMLQVTLLEQMGVDPGDIDLAPSFAALSRPATVCIFGTGEEDETGCTLDALKGTELISLPGAHHFDHDVKALGDKISAAIMSRARP